MTKTKAAEHLGLLTMFNWEKHEATVPSNPAKNVDDKKIEKAATAEMERAVRTADPQYHNCDCVRNNPIALHDYRYSFDGIISCGGKADERPDTFVVITDKNTAAFVETLVLVARE
jgi:hypothetical protein